MDEELLPPPPPPPPVFLFPFTLLFKSTTLAAIFLIVSIIDVFLLPPPSTGARAIACAGIEPPRNNLFLVPLAKALIGILRYVLEKACFVCFASRTIAPGLKFVIVGLPPPAI